MSFRRRPEALNLPVGRLKFSREDVDPTEHLLTLIKAIRGALAPQILSGAATPAHTVNRPSAEAYSTINVMTPAVATLLAPRYCARISTF